MDIQERMKPLGPFGQLDEVAFEAFRHGIEETPHRARREGFMPGLTPFVEHARDKLIRADTDIRGPDDQIMSRAIIQIGQLVGADASVLVVPAFNQLADGSLDELREVTVNVTSVFPADLHLAAEAEIVADEHAGSRDNASREHLIMAVTEAENPAVIGIGLFPLHFEQTEVTAAVVGQTVSLIADSQAVAFQRVLDAVDEVNVRDG